MTRQPQIRQGFYPIFLYYRLLQKIIFSFFATIAQVAIHIFIIITENFWVQFFYKKIRCKI